MSHLPVHDADHDTCPCCGSVVASVNPLVAATDVLVLRALELVGKRLARHDRSLFRRLDGAPWHRAYLVVSVHDLDPHALDLAMATAWDAVPLVLSEHGCCGADSAGVTATLDRYVRDLVITRTRHSVDELRYRLSAYLGVPTG